MLFFDFPSPAQLFIAKGRRQKAEGRLRREDFGVSAATELVEVQSNEGRRFITGT
jgi:hypothetical protein